MLTPLQYRMRRSRRYHQFTSVRYLSALISAVFLMIIALYCMVFIPFTSTVPTTQHHIFHWEEESEPLRAPTMKPKTHLISASSMGKMYYPWNIFSGNTNRVPVSPETPPPNTPPMRSHGNGDEHDSNGDDDDKNNDDDDTMSQKTPPAAHHRPHHDYPNPSVFGWTPNQYPNPIDDPSRCAVAYILPHLRMDTVYTTSTNMDSPVPISSSLSDLAMNHNATSDLVGNNFLRLCDPDWVLGGVYLEDVANAMFNFSIMFSSNQELVRGAIGDGSSGSSPSSNNEDWDVQVGPSTRRHRLLRSDAITSRNMIPEPTHETTAIINENNFGSSVDSSFRVRAEERDEWDTTDIQSASSGKSTSSLNPHNNWYNSKKKAVVPTIELAVATVRKMNLPAILRQSTNYYSYEDEDDMINDAAQIFARDLHDTWFSSTSNENVTVGDSRRNSDPDFGILLFSSVQDRVCFISTGSGVSTILPWWRLDHIVASIKPDLRRRDYGIALLRAIDDLSQMLQTGPPTLSDRMHDFIARFGVVIAFALFTFFFGAWGEYRDRRKRWQYAEQRSKLTSVERQKAQQLQKEFRTKCCPICLENYDYGDSLAISDESLHDCSFEDKDKDETNGECSGYRRGVYDDSANSLVSLLGDPRKGVVDECGIPRRGADGRRIKLLRCGHIFCETCWKQWVHSSACGSPCSCPVCRQDVGKSLCRNRRQQSLDRTSISSSPSVEISSDMQHEVTNSSAASNRQTYDSISDTGVSSSASRQLSNISTTGTRIIRVNTMLGGAILYRQTSATANRSTEYVEQLPGVQDDEATPLLAA